ncbi:MAG: SIMPL domain-containing protein, partial [Ruminococcus sp.]|nr:SIMPL domain-containing protein [Ruminococcus sp.]
NHQDGIRYLFGCRGLGFVYKRQSVIYGVSDIQEIHKELLKLAIEDSKNKAEMIAAFAGEKMSGIKTLKNIKSGFDSYNEKDEGYMLDDILHILDSKSSLLSSPTVEESESVEIVWFLE